MLQLPYAYPQIGADYMPRVQPAIATNPQKFIYTGAHDRIIKDALYRYHLLRAKDITRLLYPTEKQGMFTTVKQRLADLTRNKYGYNHTKVQKRPRRFLKVLSYQTKPRISVSQILSLKIG